MVLVRRDVPRSVVRIVRADSRGYDGCTRPQYTARIRTRSRVRSCPASDSLVVASSSWCVYIGRAGERLRSRLTCWLYAVHDGRERHRTHDAARFPRIGGVAGTSAIYTGHIVRNSSRTVVMWQHATRRRAPRCRTLCARPGGARARAKREGSVRIAGQVEGSARATFARRVGIFRTPANVVLPDFSDTYAPTQIAQNIL